MSLIESKNISVIRRGSPPLRFIDLSVRAGEKILILGPSGSGKTTLLSVLAGLLEPDAGHVLFEGQDLYAMPARTRDRVRGRNFGFVFQTLHLLPSLTLRKNIMLAADMAGVQRDEGRLECLVKILGLGNKEHRKPEALSQGEQQRAAIARAVFNKPRVVLADEPTSALDDANAETVMDLLSRQTADAGAALLVATHDNRITHHFKHIVRLENQARRCT